MSAESVKEGVRKYYGKELTGTKDLKSNCCTGSGRPPRHVREALSLVSDEVASHYFGCGLVVPHLVDGLKVLDLGCGAGRDCFVLSKLVGESGEVHGVDMTPEQLQIANDNVARHAQAFGYSKPNTHFHQGFIEDLSMIPSGSVDLVVSNCVVNLSTDKPAVLREAHRVLKDGGEMYFSDIYSDRRIPSELARDPVLYGECLSGALYWNDFLRLARTAGFGDPRLVEDRPVTIGNEAIQEKLGFAKFWSATYRLFKLSGLESDCEDYGQAVIYQGTIPTCPHSFKLDKHHDMEVGRVFPVCGNTFKMLHDTRFASHFAFLNGSSPTHYGVFASCGKGVPFASSCSSNTPSSSSCC